jgi:hypothetical protein
MSKQQTAVEWLYNMMLKPLSQWPDDIWEQAKQMDKDQIKAAYNQGYRDGEIMGVDLSHGNVEDFQDAEQYYNETYGTN